jgi:hypothetical protein
VTNTNPWHYDRTRMLSQLGTGFSPGFPTETARPRLNVTPFSPGSGNREQTPPLVLVGNSNQDQRCCQDRRDRQSLWSRLVLASGTKITPFCSFPYFPFDSFLFYFNFTFVLEFMHSIYIYIYTRPTRPTNQEIVVKQESTAT